MFSIDLRTMVGIAAFALLLLTITTFAAWRGMRRQIGGLGYWTLGDAAMFLSAILFATRGMLPSAISIIFANTLFFAAYALWTAGTLEFMNRPAPRRTLAVIVALVTAVLSWYLYVDESYRMRLIAASVAGISLVLLQAVPLLRHGERRFMVRLFTGTLVLQALVFAMRGVTALLSYSTAGDLFSESAIQVTYLGLTQFLVLSLALEFSLLAGLRMHQQLDRLSRNDTLTQVLNRRALLEEFDRAFDEAQTRARPVSVLTADLDYFRRYNDSHGSAAGDIALLRAAATIAAKLREGDLLGRTGGEEFSIVLPDTGSEQAAFMAERVRGAIEEGFRAFPTPLTVTLGVATMQAGDSDARQLLRRAESALQKAKTSGRNRSGIA